MHDLNVLSKHKGCEPPKAPLDQPSRIPILYMMYDSGIITGRGQAVQDDFEKLERATDTVDMLHRDHHPYLGGPRQMLNKYKRGYSFWPFGARPSCLEVLSAA